MLSIRALVMGMMLLTFCLLATKTSAQHANIRDCCRRYINVKLPFRPIIGYSVQSDDGYCPISAIIFHMKKGKACADPSLQWVMDYVHLLRTEAQMVHRDFSTAVAGDKFAKMC